LSPSETDFLLATGFHPVYLGDNVLRTETAAIYALGAVNTILLEKNEWKIGIPELKG
jgi:16S rRNA (uracil1498-N3)-methyltransferase